MLRQLGEKAPCLRWLARRPSRPGGEAPKGRSSDGPCGAFAVCRQGEMSPREGGRPFSQKVSSAARTLTEKVASGSKAEKLDDIWLDDFRLMGPIIGPNLKFDFHHRSHVLRLWLRGRSTTPDNEKQTLAIGQVGIDLQSPSCVAKSLPQAGIEGGRCSVPCTHCLGGLHEVSPVAPCVVSSSVPGPEPQLRRSRGRPCRR